MTVEPKEAIRQVLFHLGSNFCQVEELFRRGKKDEAVALAKMMKGQRMVLGRETGLSWATTKHIKARLKAWQQKRMEESDHPCMGHPSEDDTWDAVHEATGEVLITDSRYPPTIDLLISVFHEAHEIEPTPPEVNLAQSIPLRE